MPAQTGGRGPPDLTPREAMNRYLDTIRVEQRESSVTTQHYRLKIFVEWCETNGIDLVASLSGWDLETYETHRRSADIAPITLEKEMNTLQNFLEYLARVEVVPEDLPEKVHVPTADREAQSNDTRIEPRAAIDLIRYYRENDHGSRAHVLLELAWFVGARAGGLIALDVQDYDPDKQFVHFRHRPDTDTTLKNNRAGERVVGLREETCAALDDYLATERNDVTDDHGRQPLLASRVGRPSPGTIRDWMYLATIPCLHTECPHGKARESCEWTTYNEASKCPSSRSPHQIRTGSITWQLNRGVPIEVVAKRVNATVAVIEQHYDKERAVEEMEQRRRPHLDRLDIEDDSHSEDTDNDDDQ